MAIGLTRGQMGDGGRSLQVILLAIVCAAVISTATVVRLRTPHYGSAGDAAGGESGRVRSAVGRTCANLSTQAAIDAATQRGWQQLRRQMRECKAPSQEISNVIAAAKAYINPKQADPYNPINAVPVYIRQIKVGSEAAWAFGYGWEVRGIDHLALAPSHFRILIISAKAPYQILAEWGCM